MHSVCDSVSVLIRRSQCACSIHRAIGSIAMLPCHNATQRHAVVNMDITSSQLLVVAARRGDAVEVKQLLRDASVDPAFLEGRALLLAASYGHVKIVRLLLKDGRANPADHVRSALWIATHHGHVRVVKVLLKDGSADPTASDNHAMRLATEGEPRSQRQCSVILGGLLWSCRGHKVAPR